MRIATRCSGIRDTCPHHHSCRCTMYASLPLTLAIRSTSVFRTESRIFRTHLGWNQSRKQSFTVVFDQLSRYRVYTYHALVLLIDAKDHPVLTISNRERRYRPHMFNVNLPIHDEQFVRSERSAQHMS